MNEYFILAHTIKRLCVLFNDELFITKDGNFRNTQGVPKTGPF